MGSRRPLGVIAVAATCLAAAVAPAAAVASVGTPLRLGAGQYPNVTVESDGTAHLAWTGAGANSVELDYCRLPRGAGACAPRTVIAAPGDSLSKPLALGSGALVRVISYRYGGDVQSTYGSFGAVLMFTSGDGGASFGPGVRIGSIAPFDFAFGPGDSVSAITSADQCGTCYEAWPLSGGVAAGTAVLSPDHPYLGTLALLDPNTPIAVFASGDGSGQFRRYGGIGSVNDQASWTPPVDIGQLDTPHLVSGPAGTLLVAQDRLSGPTLEARRWNGTTFGSRVTIASAHGDHAAQDGLGRTHVVGGKFSAGSTGAAFFYATSDDGAAWRTEEVEYPAVPQNLRVAVAPDHLGVAVGTFADGSGVFAAAIGPAAATPRTGKFVGVTVVQAPVRVRAPGARQFAELRAGDVIPVGSVVDARRGRVRITIALPNGRLQSSDFFAGVFKVTQARSGLATMVLTGGSFRSCGRASRASAAARKKVIRQLWGDGSGKFRTRGRYAAASIRGTTWDTIDRCDGTLVRVTKGRVLVTDLKTRRKRTLRAGQSYLARARR